MTELYLEFPPDGNAKIINDEINNDENAADRQVSARSVYADDMARIEEKIDLLLQASGIDVSR